MQKSINKILIIFIVFSLFFILFACKNTDKTITDYSLDLEEYYLTGTELSTIKGNIIYSDGSKEEITADKLNLTGIDFNAEGTYNATANYNGIEKLFVFKIKKLYTVNFTAGVGGTIKGKTTQQGFIGEETEVVEAQAISGYKFVKWSDNTKNNFHQPIKITESKDISAIFELIRPVLSFYSYNVSSGQFSLSAENTLTAEYNGSLNVPDILIEGYDFKGFTNESRSAGLKTTIEGISNLISKGSVLNNLVSNASFYPVYIPLNKTITINKVLRNSSETPIAFNTVSVENFKTFNIYQLCLDNFASGNINITDFDYEWVLNDGLTIQIINDTNTFKEYYITKNFEITLRYFYKEKAVTYLYESQSHIVNVEKFQKIRPYSFLITERPDLIRPGKLLNCNYNGQIFNESQNSEITITDNININVNWTDILYTVNFIDSIIENQNTENPENPVNDKISVVSNLVYNQKVLRPDDSLVVKSSYVFKGWYYMLNGQMVEYNFDNLIIGDLNIYAQYLVPFTISFPYGTITLNYFDNPNPNNSYVITAGSKIVYFDYNCKIDNALGNYNAIIYINNNNQYIKLRGNLTPVISSYVFEGWYLQKYTQIFNVNENIKTTKTIYALQDYEKYKLVPSFTSGNAVLQCCEKRHDFTNELINVNNTVSYYRCNNPECTTFKVENVNGEAVLKVKRLCYIKILYTMEKGKKLDSIDINGITVNSTATEYTSIINADNTTTISFKKTMDDNLFKAEGNTKVLPLRIINSYMDITISVTNALNKTVYNNVTISASSGQFTAKYNSDVLLTFIANDGFSVQSAVINGVTVNVGNGNGDIIYDENNASYYYTITHIQSNSTVSVNTVERYHNISINQNFAFTKIVKEDFITTDTSIARYNTNKYITFKPDLNSEIISINVNNVLYYDYINGLLTPAEGDPNLIFDRKGSETDFYLTIKNISKNYNIDVIYSLKEMSYKITVTNGYLTNIVINNEHIALGVNQNVFLSGDRKLTYGMSVLAEYNMTDSTYILDYININGERVTELPAVITNNYDINVVYKKIRYTIGFEVQGQGNNYGKYYVVKNAQNQTVNDPIVYDCFLANPKTYSVVIGPPLNYEISKVERVSDGQTVGIAVNNGSFNVTEDNNNVHYIITLKLHEYAINITLTDKFNNASVQYGDVNSDSFQSEADGTKRFTVYQPYYTSRTMYINIDNLNAARLTEVVINTQYELIKYQYEINNITQDYEIIIKIEENRYIFETPATDSRYTLSIQYKNELNQFVDINYNQQYLHGTVIRMVMTSADYALKQMNITYANLNGYDNFVENFVYPESYIQYNETAKTYTCHFNLEGDIVSENINFTLE